MKISNRVTYNALMRIGKQGWGDWFEKFVPALAETLEHKISQKKKLDAKLINEAIEEVQAGKMTFPVSEAVKKEAFILLGKCWEHADKIKKLMERGKI